MPKIFKNIVYANGLHKLPIFATVDGEKRLDFNLIIPEPVNEEECPEKYLLTADGKDYKGQDPKITKFEDRPWFNWYDWRRDNWGCKWNADTEEIAKNFISFFTPDAPALPVLLRLSMMTNARIRVEIEDIDDWGVDRYTLHKGQVIDE